MAKDGDKGEDGENYEFLPPDFDEDAFIHKEMVSYKTTVILFLWGILAALVSWGIFAGIGGAKSGWSLGLLVCALMGGLLKWIFPRFKADIKHFGRREWLGTAALFFFTWLSFFILAINPPISDYAPPRVAIYAAPPVQQSGGDVTLDLFFEDNERVADYLMQLKLGPNDLTDPSRLIDRGKGHFQYTATALPPGNYTVFASATDGGGRQTNTESSFQVVAQPLRVFLPDAGTLDAPGDAVTVQSAGDIPTCITKKKVGITNEPCIRIVRLEMFDRATPTAVPMEWSVRDGAWHASANFAGWQAGNNSFKVVGEVVDGFHGSERIDGGDLIAAGPFTVTVTAPLGSFVPTEIKQPNAPLRSVPGMELGVLAFALLALAVAARRRQE